MDEYEAALRHSVVEPTCPLLAEIHSTLIYNLRTVPSNRHAAVLSLTDADQNPDHEEDLFGVSVDTLTSAMADLGNNWERAPLRHAEGRDGWEESLIGCLKDVSSSVNYLEVLSSDRPCLYLARHTGELSSPSRNLDEVALRP